MYKVMSPPVFLDIVSSPVCGRYRNWLICSTSYFSVMFLITEDFSYLLCLYLSAMDYEFLITLVVISPYFPSQLTFFFHCDIWSRQRILAAMRNRRLQKTWVFKMPGLLTYLQRVLLFSYDTIDFFWASKSPLTPWTMHLCCSMAGVTMCDCFLLKIRKMDMSNISLFHSFFSSKCNIQE